MQQEPFRHLQQSDVIDVWDCQFMTVKMQKVPPEDSDVFSVNLRIKQQVQDDIAKANGCNGTYIEPRSPDGRHPDDSFQVVWLPRKTFGEAQVCQKTSKTPTTLVRQADRYGLRVLNEEAEALHRIHRPDLVYIQGTELTKYRVGPMPFGSTKQSLGSCFLQMGVESETTCTTRPGQGQIRGHVGSPSSRATVALGISTVSWRCAHFPGGKRCPNAAATPSSSGLVKNNPGVASQQCHPKCQ